MFKFYREYLEDCLDEIKPLLKQHWIEIADDKDDIKLNPDYDKYQLLEDAGVLHIVVARDEGRLVGYFVSLISPHIHYKEHLFAMNDILFIHHDYRGTTLAYRMFKFAFKELQKLGVKKVIVHQKVGFPFERLCLALGMSPFEKSYSLTLGK